MANYNLTAQQIKDSFQQLAQVSGSIEVGVSGYAILDGSGSRANTLHVTASHATNAVSASFATTALSASYAPGTGVTSIIAGTGISVDQATGNVTVSNTEGAAATGSLLVTSSATNNVITFTKGDGSTYTNTIDTGSGGAAFPFTGNAQITGSLVVSGSGLSSGDDVFVLGFPRTGGSSLEGAIRSTVDDGLHLYGNKNFNNGSNTFAGGINSFETETQFGNGGGAIGVKFFNNSAITASGGTLPISGAVEVDGNIKIQGTGTTLQVGDSTTPAGTPNVNLKQNYSGSAAKFANITIDDTSGTYSLPTLLGRFSNAVSAFGNSAGSPFTLLAGGAAGGAFNHWGLVLDQTGDIKSLKEMNMYSGAKVSGSLVVTGSATLTGSLNVNGTVNSTGNNTVDSQFPVFQAKGDSGLGSIYAGFQINDVSSTANTNFAVSTFTGLDGSNPVFELIGPGTNRLAWSSTNFPYLHVPQLLKAQSGAQITGSLDVTGAITAASATFQSASIGYLQTVTGSATIIGSQYVVLNADSPTNRFAGIKVYDSGSGLTGSFEWDSVDDNWIQVETGGSSAGMLTGLSGSKGSEAYPSNNTLLKGTGNHTVQDSIITDNGTTVTVAGGLASSGSSINLFTDSPTSNGQIVKALEFSENTSVRGNTYDSNYIGAMNYTAFGDRSDKALTMWKSRGTSEYGFIYNSGNTMGMYMRNVSGSTGDVSLFTDHGGSGDANFKVVVDNIELTPKSSFKVDGTSTFTDIEIGRSSISSFKLVTDETNPIQITGSLDLTQGITTNGITNSGSLIYTGSSIGNLTALGITSNTASIDFRNGDYYTLDLVSGSNTHLEIDPSGTKPGQTAILKVKQPDPGSGTLTYGDNFKFPGGTIPDVTEVTSAEDIFTFVQFGFNETYVTAVNNLS